MHIYRLTWSRFDKDITGTGSFLNGGRWNSPGIYCVYAAESRALAVLEYAVNITIDAIPAKLSLVTLEIPDHNHKIFSADQLPENWDCEDVSEITRNFGNPFLEKGEHLILKIPSVVIPQEFNILLNPRHPEMKEVSIADISPFSFDARLKK